MVFPMKKKPAQMIDDPSDDIGQPPHAEPDEDESYIDDIMGEDVSAPGEEEGTDKLFGESPLQSALTEAGYKPTPAQMAEIEAILSKKPEVPTKPMGMKPKPASAIGGAVPGGMTGSDISMK